MPEKDRKHKLVLGFANWGKKAARFSLPWKSNEVSVSVPVMMATVEGALKNGVDEIDCAPHYGNGAREVMLGGALLNLTEADRKKVKLSTKVGRVINPDNKAKDDDGFQNASGLAQEYSYTAAGIMASFEQSRQRLLVSIIDTLYLHDLDPQTHGSLYSQRKADFLNDGYKAFEALKGSGKIKLAGLGSNDYQTCIDFIRDGRFKIDRILLAGCYNLLNHETLKEFFPLCKERNIQIYIAAPYCGGLLSGETGNVSYKYKKATPDILKKTAQIKAICDQFRVSLPHAAMQFVHLHPQAERVVVGARTPHELAQSIKYAQTPINPRFWLALKQEKLIPDEAPTDLPLAMPARLSLLKPKPSNGTVEHLSKPTPTRPKAKL